MVKLQEVVKAAAATRYAGSTSHHSPTCQQKGKCPIPRLKTSPTIVRHGFHHLSRSIPSSSLSLSTLTLCVWWWWWWWRYRWCECVGGRCAVTTRPLERGCGWFSIHHSTVEWSPEPLAFPLATYSVSLPLSTVRL